MESVVAQRDIADIGIGLQARSVEAPLSDGHIRISYHVDRTHASLVYAQVSAHCIDLQKARRLICGAIQAIAVQAIFALAAVHSRSVAHFFTSDTERLVVAQPARDLPASHRMSTLLEFDLVIIGSKGHEFAEVLG